MRWLFFFGFDSTRFLILDFSRDLDRRNFWAKKTIKLKRIDQSIILSINHSTYISIDQLNYRSVNLFFDQSIDLSI